VRRDTIIGDACVRLTEVASEEAHAGTSLMSSPATDDLRLRFSEALFAIEPALNS
jgi:hypothetical protein